MSPVADHREPSDAVYRALADPTRRAMLSLLSEAPRTVSELAEPFDMSQPNVSLHLANLREAGLVQVEKSGRHRIYRLEPAPLRGVAGWLDGLAEFWERRLDALGVLLAEDDEAAEAPARKPSVRAKRAGKAPARKPPARKSKRGRR